VDQIKEELKVLDYVPIPSLIPIWDAYWEIKNTKTYDSPITHTDILSYQTLMKWEMSIVEVRQLLKWDREWYKAYTEHNK